MTRTFTGFDRGNRGTGVRDLVVALPSVGCTNRTVELLGRAEPRLRFITHQHGCSQLGDDLGVTADLLARICGHPNVRSALIVGLGCESNQSDRLLARAQALGADARRLVLQEQGGIENTIAAARSLLHPLLAAGAERVPVPASRLRLGIVCDDDAGQFGRELSAAIAARVAAEGLDVLEAPAPPLAAAPPLATEFVAVPGAWAGRRLPVVGAAPLGVANRNEQLAVLAARGAQACVFVTGGANPVGSPVLPTLKVGVTPRFAPLVGGVLDLLVDAGSTTAGEGAEAVLECLAAMLDGEPAAAERAGQRDFGIPRLTPSM